MASTYALPLNPAAQTHHGHSRSQLLSSHASPRNGQANGVVPTNGHSPSSGHRHYKSEVNSQLRNGQTASPYADSHDRSHSHSHSHDQSHSHDRGRSSEFSLKPFMPGRPKMRSRGESDLGRPASRTRTTTAGKFGAFSPIQEGPPPLPLSASSWLELPEALTALLIPLPYLFASLAYPSIVVRAQRLPSAVLNTGDQLLESVSNKPDTLGVEALLHGSRLLHACTLTSTTLILVGLISKIRSSTQQPLDRRKSFGNTEKAGAALNAHWGIGSLWPIITNILSVMLPFYATMQLGGAKTALILLVAVTAGLGGLDHKPGKHTLWDALKRTVRTRKATCATIVLIMLVEISSSTSASGALFGYLALMTSIIAMPPPLPTAGWSLVTGLKGQNDLWSTQGSARLSLPKPSSPLINTSEDTLLTLGSGVLLMTITVLYSMFSSVSPSISHHAILFSTLSVASATALIYFSLPSALRTQKKAGLGFGCVLVAVFAPWEQQTSWQAGIMFPLVCVLAFGAITYDTRSPAISHTHSHDHSHSGHKQPHAHHDHDHHLHGNHSRLSAFLIARCTPGSIMHSILIEKDSRRIAYFGVLNLAFMLVQFFYGFVSGSLGLLTDSIHMLFDCAGLSVGLAAAVMSKWRPNVHFPYGYGKIDTLSGFANGVFLLLVSVEIIVDAFERLWEGSELHRLNELLIVSVLGFLVNIVGLTAFGHAHHGHGHSHDHGDGDHDHGHGHSHDNENMQGIFLHILADALGSVAVIISTLLTKYYGWTGWDPIASGIIAILIFASAIPLVKSSGMRLLLSLPADVEYGIRNTLQELSSLRGVVGYSVPRFWLEDEGAAHAEVHAKENEGCDHDHSHAGHDHSHAGHDHSDHNHDHSNHSHAHNDNSVHSHSHDHSNHSHAHNDNSVHSHSHEDSHSHGQHDHSSHDHSHDHEHASHQQRVLGVIHIIASRIADLEDVRERTLQFLKGRGMDVVVHIEKEGEGRCWCGGGNKTY